IVARQSVVRGIELGMPHGLAESERVELREDVSALAEGAHELIHAELARAALADARREDSEQPASETAAAIEQALELVAGNAQRADVAGRDDIGRARTRVEDRELADDLSFLHGREHALSQQHGDLALHDDVEIPPKVAALAD